MMKLSESRLFQYFFAKILKLQRHEYWYLNLNVTLNTLDPHAFDQSKINLHENLVKKADQL